MAEAPDPVLALTWDPDPAEVAAIHDLISASNVETTGIDDGRMFAVWLRGPGGKIAGGACGWTWGGTCYLDALLLPAALRRRGLGGRIVALVEAAARAGGCHQIVLHTHDFQAPAFYQRLGFERIAATAGYPRGHAHLTMVKRLSGGLGDHAGATGRRQLAHE